MLAPEHNQPLFSINDVRSRAELQAKFGVTHAVNALPAGDFAKHSDDELVDMLTQNLTVEPLRLGEPDRRPISAREVVANPQGHIDRLQWAQEGYEPGLIARFSISYTGASVLWQLRPYPEWNIAPRGNIVEESPTHGSLEIVLTAIGSGDELQAQFDASLDEELAKVRACIEAQTPFVPAATDALRERIREEVTKRRKRVDFLASITSPRPPVVGEPDTVGDLNNVVSAPIDLPRRTVRIFERIDARQFEDILAPFRALGRAYEQLPGSLSGLPEERIRDHFIVQLNILFGASTATAESFSHKGRTDIRVVALNFSAFIAECKLWNGPKKTVDDAFRQIFEYASPQDRRCALLIFNRRKAKNLYAVVETALAAHRQTTEKPRAEGCGEWRMKIAPGGDAEREISLHVFVFDYRLI